MSDGGVWSGDVEFALDRGAFGDQTQEALFLGLLTTKINLREPGSINIRS
jgi:hypothetical protein